MRHKILLIAAAGIFLFGLAGGVSARTQRIEGAEVTLPEIGDPAPDFKLFGVDYRYHFPRMYDDSRAIVLVFTCNHCPVSVAYEDDLVEMAGEYQDKNIQFIAINTNPVDKVARDGFPQMIERAREKNFSFPYLYDETQKVSAAYGARRTPHIYVLGETDGDARSIVYMGTIDNRHEEPYYLRDALDAILEGEEIPVEETSARGCTVKYRTAEERIAKFGFDIFEDR